MSRQFEELKESLEEALAYEQGKITLRSEKIIVPKPPAAYKAKDIKRIRKKGNYSQSIFAALLNVSPRTVQSWESGVREPNHSALRLLEIVDKGFYPPKARKRAST
jgi:putative transcriptional regulator